MLHSSNVFTRFFLPMRLYHYTSAALADSILLSGLSQGHMNTPDGVLKPVVWLTSDPQPEGHGLTDGTETLSDRNMVHVKNVTGQRPKNRRTSDKMKVRLTFEIPAEEMPQLQKFTEYCDRYPEGKLFAKLTGLSCYVDTASIDTKRLKTLLKSRPTKEKTWWISFMPISARFITAYELRGGNGVYCPYDFEKLARPALGELGFYFPSPEALRDLQTIVKPLHPLGFTKASVICTDPHAKPFVMVRDAGIDFVLEIETGRYLTDRTSCEPQLSAWVGTYRAELTEAWAQAKESYYSYYPEHRP